MGPFKIVFLTLVVSLLLAGCSSFLMRQGYRLDSEFKSSQISEACSNNREKYKGAEINSYDVKIMINFENRARTSLMGPPLIPLIPIGFGEDKNVSAFVTANDLTQDLQTDFKRWQFSADGKSWSYPTKVIPVVVYSDGQVIFKMENGIQSEDKRPRGTQLLSNLNMKEAETIFIKTAEVSAGSQKIPPMILKWNRENYSRYTPLIGGMDGEAKSMLICR